MGVIRLVFACTVAALLHAFLRSETISGTTVPALNTPHWVAIRGQLPDQVYTELEALPEVEVISPTGGFSFLGCSEITIHMQWILVMANLEFYTETNQQIHIQTVRLEPYKPKAKNNNQARQQSAELDTTLPWNLDRIDQLSNTLNNIYNPPNTADNIDIYVLDTGVNLAHQEFDGRATRVTAFKDEDPCLSTAHGSWVASIAAGAFYGVAKDANIKDMKLPNGDSCDFYTSDAAAALNYLLLNVDVPFVVVMSWSAPNTPALNAILQDLNTKGAVLINAAGNDGDSSLACLRSPGSSGVTYSVGSVGRTLVRSSFSNYGTCIDGFAPGEEIIGAGLASSTQLVQGDGTSASCPMEGGRAAVLMKQFSLTNPTSVYNALITYSQKDVVISPGSGSPNRFCNFEGNVVAGSPPTSSSSKFNVFL